MLLDASGKSGKRGDAHVSSEIGSLILHPHTTIHVIVESVDFSGIVPDLYLSQEDQSEAH